MTNRTCTLIHDDGGTTVTIYDNGVQTDRFYVNAESNIAPLSLVPGSFTITTERWT